MREVPRACVSHEDDAREGGEGGEACGFRCVAEGDPGRRIAEGVVFIGGWQVCLDLQ